MSNAIPLILIILSSAVIVFIVARKLPQLRLLDVETLPEFQQGKKKDEFFRKRMEKNTKVIKDDWLVLIRPLVNKWKKIQLSFRQYVGKVERSILAEKRKKKTLREKKMEKVDLKTLLQEGDYAFEQKDWDTAEQKYIAAVRIDQKNREGYYGLGKVYFEQGQHKEAEETFKFLLRLNPQDDSALIKLGELAEQKGNKQEALEYYQQSVLIDDTKSAKFFKIAELLGAMGQYETALEAVSQAVELEPGNPRYLDMLVEISIMCRNKPAAEETFQKLRMVNPDNQKLSAFRERIDKLAF